MTGPLAGFRVIDTSSVVAAPLATMMLADQGADVIKVEAPGRGDLLRIEAFRRGGLTSLFANVNRGKRSIVIDLRTDRGRELVLQLVRGADVFVENYRPGVAERLGIGPQVLRAAKQDLIYCSVTGYGDSGPYRGRRAYDPIIQGITGHVAVQKHPEVPLPDLVRNIVVDKASAYAAAQAITAALLARERGAGGQTLQIPMIDVSLAFFWPDGMMAHTLLGEDVREGPTLYERYRITETADGHLVYWAGPDEEWYAVFRSLGRADLCEDAQFRTAGGRTRNAVALGEILKNEFHKWTTAEILRRMVDEDVPVGPVLELDEIALDPQVVHNDRIFERAHPTAGTLRECRPAARFSATPQHPGPIAPLHGEHTDLILAELGYDRAAIAALHDGAIVHTTQ